MRTATIDVQYVNPPKTEKGPGSVKDSQGTLYKVWRNMLDKFETGRSYEVQIEDTEWQGRAQHEIKKIVTVGQKPTQATPVGAKVGNGFRPDMSPKDAQGSFCTVIMEAFVKAGKVPLNATAIGEAYREIRKGYEIGQAAAASPRDDIYDDEVPL